MIICRLEQQGDSSVSEPPVLAQNANTMTFVGFELCLGLRVLGRWGGGLRSVNPMVTTHTNFVIYFLKLSHNEFHNERFGKRHSRRHEKNRTLVRSRVESS